MNAIEFLTKEHEKVRLTLGKISAEAAHEATRKKLFDGLCQDLLRHEEMEHQIWYPHFKNDKRLTDTVKHLLTEEKSAEKAIKHFDEIKTLTEWEEKFSKFKKDVEHHAREEEHDLFPQVKKILSEQELNLIGKQMSEFKKKHH